MSTWNPIDTAPTDQWVLVSSPAFDGEVEVAIQRLGYIPVYDEQGRCAGERYGLGWFGSGGDHIQPGGWEPLVGRCRRASHLAALGAAVAMVAAARMVLGEWSDKRDLSSYGVMHWDFVEPWMSCRSHAACGDVYPDDYGAVSGIEDVDCAVCLAIHARASEVKP